MYFPLITVLSVASLIKIAPWAMHLPVHLSENSLSVQEPPSDLSVKSKKRNSKTLYHMYLDLEQVFVPPRQDDYEIFPCLRAAAPSKAGAGRCSLQPDCSNSALSGSVSSPEDFLSPALQTPTCTATRITIHQPEPASSGPF